MEDKEKVLRWNLQESMKELREPILDGLTTSAIYGVMKHREDNIKKCQNELDAYLKTID